jgi:hypothetical protein
MIYSTSYTTEVISEISGSSNRAINRSTEIVQLELVLNRTQMTINRAAADIRDEARGVYKKEQLYSGPFRLIHST